ncbi:MAG: hypothetical protein JO087_03025, partial [Actinobacteria bacterium]|nr:hypothetical protein [Actinomycetota bacterium]
MGAGHDHSHGSSGKLTDIDHVGIDQKQFNRFASKDDVSAFRKHVSQITDGGDAHIVCDMLRG